MTILPISTPAAAGTNPAAAPSQPAAGPDNVNENQFLQLLVAQIHYQDPTNPADSTTFVTQLAQFSSLEQLVAIRSDMDGVAQYSATGSTSTTQGGN